MKRILSMTLAAALLATAAAPATAGGYGHGHRGGYAYVPAGHHHGGYGVGAFFAGLIGGAILSTVIHESRPAPAYAAPPPEQVWVEGRYETRHERRWVPGHWEEERAYRGDDRNDRWDDDEDDDGGARRVWVPGRYRDVPVKVWVEGHWEPRG